MISTVSGEKLADTRAAETAAITLALGSGESVNEFAVPLSA